MVPLETISGSARGVETTTVDRSAVSIAEGTLRYIAFVTGATETFNAAVTSATPTVKAPALIYKPGV
jgi:hypothetical protein